MSYCPHVGQSLSMSMQCEGQDTLFHVVTSRNLHYCQHIMSCNALLRVFMSSLHQTQVTCVLWTTKTGYCSHRSWSLLKILADILKFTSGRKFHTANCLLYQHLSVSRSLFSEVGCTNKQSKTSSEAIKLVALISLRTTNFDSLLCLMTHKEK